MSLGLLGKSGTTLESPNRRMSVRQVSIDCQRSLALGDALLDTIGNAKDRAQAKVRGGILRIEGHRLDRRGLG
jgi:hypothetical protein